MTEEITPATVSPEALAFAFIEIAADPKAAKARLLAHMGAKAQAEKAIAAAEKAEAALAQEKAAQEAQLAKCWKELEAEKEAVAVEKAMVAERYEGIDAAQRDIDAQNRRLASSQMAFLGLTRHPLQDEPTVESLEPLLYGGRNDAHFSDAIEQPVFGSDPVEHAPAAATIRRSKPSRPSRADA